LGFFDAKELNLNHITLKIRKLNLTIRERSKMTSTREELKQLIVEFSAELYEKRLTDVAGGNISVRESDVILMTPTLAGNLYHWRLRPEQILTLDLQGRKIEGEGNVSREVKVHAKLLNDFYPDGTAVVHAHSRNILVFCAAEKPIPPVLNATMKFGEIQHCVDAPSGTQELADNIAQVISGQEERIRKQAALALAPRHGVFAIGKNIYAAYDAVERVDTNAYCILAGGDLFDFKTAEEVPYEDTE
jgi:L-fuculose-phosphate aldolase